MLRDSVEFSSLRLDRGNDKKHFRSNYARFKSSGKNLRRIVWLPAEERGAMPVIHNRPVAPGRKRAYQPRQWMPGVPEIADLRSAALAK